jgi:hypothetical protein
VWLASQGSTAIFSIGILDSDTTLWQIKDELTGYSTGLWYTIVPGEWVRIEAELYRGTFVFIMNAYLNAADAVDEDVQASQLIQVSGSGTAPVNYLDTVAFGYPVSHAHYEPVQVSGVAVSVDDWIGPAPRQHKGWPNMQPRTLAARHDSSW